MQNDMDEHEAGRDVNERDVNEHEAGRDVNELDSSCQNQS